MSLKIEKLFSKYQTKLVMKNTFCVFTIERGSPQTHLAIKYLKCCWQYYKTHCKCYLILLNFTFEKLHVFSDCIIRYSYRSPGSRKLKWNVQFKWIPINYSGLLQEESSTQYLTQTQIQMFWATVSHNTQVLTDSPNGEAAGSLMITVFQFAVQCSSAVSYLSSKWISLF